ncbi:demethylmenaquinone methyltransferase-like isoform X1 [Mya arenaria]|uniref:demethylmenaquinone methyltransferase-like isoform X1 n=1 Tax=Mya arenaria TaxID=6604 RepID=UPI0022E208E9|nr:demethylmenaquinone methyltransferase-like isoform X1 [Mya arenaria]XP_052788419.1 demethylmenaquinone methyltransferase-like isoform X1 [Mya arenaria]
MSTYENYESVSKTYDDQRKAMGSDVIAGMIQLYCKKPLSELHVLDAGCGTGNYARDLLDHGCGHVTLLDASPGMLEKARAKVADYIESGRVKDIVEAKLPKIPFPDGTFDAVMFNLVLHHLNTGVAGDCPTTVEVLKEAKRVLNSINGCLVITTSLPSQMVNCLWTYEMVPSLFDRYNKKFISVEQWPIVFAKGGFECVQRVNVLGTKFTLFNSYYNFEGPLDPEWRKGTSWWAIATEEELATVRAKILDLKAKGELEKWCTEHDRVSTSGLLTLMVATVQ